jgi:isopentenyl diphosphate isomerase/L-lactate dehydrogenase-like FMN-dependent dehydrogenase
VAQGPLSGLPIADLGRVARKGDGAWWFQVYMHRGRSFTQSLVGDGLATGTSSLVLMVDSPVLLA